MFLLKLVSFPTGLSVRPHFLASPAVRGNHVTDFQSMEHRQGSICCSYWSGQFLCYMVLTLLSLSVPFPSASPVLPALLCSSQTCSGQFPQGVSASPLAVNIFLLVFCESATNNVSHSSPSPHSSSSYALPCTQLSFPVSSILSILFILLVAFHGF